MSAASLALPPSTPWSLRLLDRARLAPVWTGLLVSAAWFGVFLVYSALFGDGLGRFDKLGGSTWPSEIIWSLLIGMPPVVTAYTLRGGARDLEDLTPALGAGPDELGRLRREIATVPRAWVTGAGIVSMAFSFVANAFNPALWADGQIPEGSDPVLIWLVVRNVLNAWMISRAVVLELLLARAFSRLGERLVAIDLLDRAPLAPFGRRGLRSVLLWMLLLALFAPLWVLDAAEPLLLVALLGVLSFALAAFLLPVGGAHRRIRAAKERELSRVRGALRDARERALAQPDDDPRGGRVADLVAWEQRVAAAGEWPFGATTVLRFGLYLAIGMGSWIGAALVERVLETAFR